MNNNTRKSANINDDISSKNPTIAAITKGMQEQFIQYLEIQGQDYQSMTVNQKSALLQKFLETDYSTDALFLDKNTKWSDIAQEQYFLDEFMQDAPFAAYIHKTQGSLPFDQGCMRTILKKMLALPGLPDAYMQDIQALQDKNSTSPLSTLQDFQRELQTIIDIHSNQEDDSHKLTADQMKQIHNISINNQSILDTMKDEGLITEQSYQDIITKSFDKRSEEEKKIWSTQLRKQVAHNYLDLLQESKNASEGMAGLVRTPSITQVMVSYCKKLDIDYDDFIEKQKPAFSFDTLSAQEKQSMLDIMVEEYYIPNAAKFGEKLGLNYKQYEAFVRKLFSLEDKELIIPGPEGNQIPLRFLKKDITGIVNIDTSDGLGDQPIPFDFVLDANNQDAMQKLASTMPGKDRSTIHNIKHDPKQELIVTLPDGKKVAGYSYRIMHDGVEQNVITQKPISTHHPITPVLCKDGTYKPVKNTQEDEVVMLPSDTKTDYSVSAKEPLVYSMKPQDVSGLLTAYCLNNSSKLTAEDKAKLFVDVPKNQKLSGLFTDQILGKDDETQKATSDQEQQADETPESYQMRMQASTQEAIKARDNISGRGTGFSTSFGKGTQLAIQNVDSIFKEIPGNGGFMILEIIDADDRKNPTKFKYKVVGGSETDIDDEHGGNLTGKESDRLGFTKEFFDKLRDHGRGTLYKLPPKNAANNLIDYLKDVEFDNPGMNIIKSQADKLDVDGSILKRNGEQIKYFGMPTTSYDKDGNTKENYVMFSVDFHDDGVTVKDNFGSYSKDMSYAQFTLFVADKGLNPYTETDYQELVGPYNNEHSNSKKAVFWFSPMNMIEGAKKRRQGTVVDGAKKNNERRVEKVEEMFYTSGMTNMLGKMPFWGEYFVQAQDEFDTKIADKHHKIVMEGDKTLGQRGKNLIWGKQTFLDNHNLKGRSREACFDKIIELFEKAGKPGGLDDVDRRQAFAGLLYVLEKFQTPYPRRLAKYAGNNFWPRILLSKEKYAQYLHGFNQAKAKLEAGQARGEDVRELMDNVAQYDVKNMSELMKDEYHRYLYGYKSIPVLQEAAGKRADDTARKDGAQAAGHHPAFGRAYHEEVTEKLKNGQYAYAIGALVQISKRKEIGNPANYRRWLAGVIQVIVSGGMKYAANKSDRKYLRDFLRKHGLPISDYILDNSQGGKDLAILLDVISRKSGCTQGFMEATGWNPALEDYETWSKGDLTNKKDRGAHWRFNGKFDKWFLGESNAMRITPFLENSNLHKSTNLATLVKDPSLSPQERGVIERYLNVSLNANNTRDYGAYRGGEDFVQNLIQDRTIFNTSRWLVEEEYLKYSDGGYGSKQEEVQYFWNSLRDYAKRMAATDTREMPKESIELFLQKYYGMFQTKYGGTYERFTSMIACIKNTKNPDAKKKYAKAAITDYIRRVQFTNMPPMMSEAFGAIEDFIINHADKIDEEVIGNVVKFDDIESTQLEREKGIKAFGLINNPKTRDTYKHQIHDYIDDLRTGAAQGAGRGFPGLDIDYKSSKKRQGGYDDFIAGTAQAEMANAEVVQATQAATNQKAQEEADMKKEEDRQEAERKKKEQEEAEAKQRQEEDQKNQEGGAQK